METSAFTTENGAGSVARRFRRKKSSSSNGIFAAGLVALSCVAMPAAANDDAPLKRGGFQFEVLTADTITITTSEDGSVGSIQEAPIFVGIKGKIDFKRRNGYLERAGIFAGYCKRQDCGPFHPLLWYRGTQVNEGTDGGALPENDWTFNHTIPFHPRRLLLPTEQIGLIDECRAIGEGSFSHGLTVTMSANTRTRDPHLGEEFIGAVDPANIGSAEELAEYLDTIEFNGGDQSRDADFSVTIDCQQVSPALAPQDPPEPRTVDNQELNVDPGEMSVNDIKLSISTYSNALSEPTPGTQCKKGKLRVELDTNQAGPVSFKLWEMRDGNIEDEDIDLEAEFDGNGFFKAVYERWIEVDETTHLQFNARELVSEVFQKEAGWDDITLHCTGAGGGGLTTTPENDHGIATTPFEGDFSFADLGAQGQSCPRQPKALIWFDAPKSDNIHYSLDCGALGNFSGVLQPQEIGDHHYRAGKLVTFDLNDTIEAGCTLRTVSPGPERDHSFKAQLFQCAETNGFDDGIEDMTEVPDKSDSGLPQPTIDPKVNPAVGNGPSGLVAEPRPTHSDPASSPKTPVKPVVKAAVCKGGKMSHGLCICPAGRSAKKTSRFEYHCKRQVAEPKKPKIKTAPIVRVTPKPENKKPVRVTPSKPKKAGISCRGGKVAGNRCRCPAKASLVQLGKSKFACRKKFPQRAEAKPIPKKQKKALRTNAPPKRSALICKGGKARGNQCLCGKKKVVKRLGKNSFACVRRKS